MERIVRKVEATRHMHTLAPLSMPTVRKTACYIRVSTLDESQDTSFQAQRAHSKIRPSRRSVLISQS